MRVINNGIKLKEASLADFKNLYLFDSCSFMHLQQKFGTRNFIFLQFDTKQWNHGIKYFCKIIIYKTS